MPRCWARLRRPPALSAEIEPLIETLKTYPPERREQFIARLCGHAPAASKNTPATSTVSWDDIREMDAAGVKIGCHTQTHQILTAVPAQTARQEISESKHAIEAALNKRCGMFAYPNGNRSCAHAADADATRVSPPPSLLKEGRGFRAPIRLPFRE